MAETVSCYGWRLLPAGVQPLSFTEDVIRGKPVWVPDRLPPLDADSALARVALPVHLNWSAPGRVFNLAERGDRARVYEVILQEGRPADILAYVDGVLLADLWDDLVLPRAVRAAWSPVIAAAS